MKNYQIKPYQSNDYKNWNDFVSHSKNGTFLFHRDFMSYHADRFDDCSLIVLDGEKWVAILPANVVDEVIYSHQGLTYGGLIYNDKIKLTAVIEIFKSILEFLFNKNIKNLHLKLIPSIYHQKPADELLYALFLLEARLTKRDSLSVVDLRENNIFSKGKREGITKGVKSDLKIIETPDFTDFWNEILTPNMIRKHNVKPIHSLEEITKLNKLFPENIRQFNVYQNDKIVAGTTIFESKTVAHAQYIFGDDTKKSNGSLDFLYNHLITNVFNDKKFLDFGSSNGYQGNKLNVKLSYWKQAFGASTIIQDFYEVETKNYHLLDLDI